jgi:hypothetical protein
MTLAVYQYTKRDDYIKHTQNIKLKQNKIGFLNPIYVIN